LENFKTESFSIETHIGVWLHAREANLWVMENIIQNIMFKNNATSTKL
jgi:hypothetical protein